MHSHSQLPDRGNTNTKASTVARRAKSSMQRPLHAVACAALGAPTPTLLSQPFSKPPCLHPSSSGSKIVVVVGVVVGVRARHEIVVIAAAEVTVAPTPAPRYVPEGGMDGGREGGREESGGRDGRQDEKTDELAARGDKGRQAQGQAGKRHGGPESAHGCRSTGVHLEVTPAVIPRASWQSVLHEL